MMATVTLFCEDCKTHVEVVAYWDGRDEDGRDNWDVERGVEPDDQRHLDADHDLSLPNG